VDLDIEFAEEKLDLAVRGKPGVGCLESSDFERLDDRQVDPDHLFVASVAERQFDVFEVQSFFRVLDVGPVILPLGQEGKRAQVKSEFVVVLSRQRSIVFNVSGHEVLEHLLEHLERLFLEAQGYARNHAGFEDFVLVFGARDDQGRTQEGSERNQFVQVHFLLSTLFLID
jgi:hypothetical protein